LSGARSTHNELKGNTALAQRESLAKIGGRVHTRNVSLPQLAGANVCNSVLGAHGNYYDMESKYARMTGSANPFIDPKGYQKYVDEREQAFRAEVSHQQAAAR
jgi:hypothetical protein